MKRITALWIITGLIIFQLMIIFGILMRLGQAGLINVDPLRHFQILTIHGLGMVGILFPLAMAGVNYFLTRYVNSPLWPNVTGYLFTVIGIVLILVTVFIGGLHTGWYFLYPLPYFARTEQWATVLFLLSIAILGTGWFIWSAGMLGSILKRYPLFHALGWHHIAGITEPNTPPFILILTTTLIGVITCLIAGVVLIILWIIEIINIGKPGWLDPLLMKNLTFLFGHTLVNEMLYLGVASVYELFPSFADKPPYRTKSYVAIAWNLIPLVVLLAYFHHLYMDFAQPLTFQFIGQIASWTAPIPAVAVTLFTVLSTVYGSKVRWNMSASFFFLGILFWMIGGVGAILDATIANNFILHNTLWVPAHFHTYNLLGNVFFTCGYISYFISGGGVNGKAMIWLPFLISISGFGFILMFYISGAYSVPRRYNFYPDVVSTGRLLAGWGAMFATFVFILFAVFSVYVISASFKILWNEGK